MAYTLPLVWESSVLGVKTETTIGAYSAASAAANCAFKSYNADLNPDIEQIERQRQGGIGVDSWVPGRRTSTLRFQTHLIGSALSAGPYEASVLWPACGLGATGATFAGSSTMSAWHSLSAGLYRGGRLKVGRGMMGSCRLTGEAGRPVLCDWTFQGGWQASPTDASAPGGISYPSAMAPTWDGTAGLTLDSSTEHPVARWELDLGNSLSYREDPNSSGGILCGWISTRRPTLTLDPEAALVATKSWHAALLTGTAIPVVIVVGATAGNIITITLSCQQTGTPAEANREGKVADSLTLGVINDSISIAYT